MKKGLPRWLCGLFAVAACAGLMPTPATAQLRTIFNNPLTLGGSRLDYRPGDANTINDYNNAAYDKRAWKAYEARRGDIDAQIDACRDGEPCTPRFRAWVGLIDQVRRIDNPLLKIEIVNAWFNSLITFTRYNALTNGHLQWIQTPQELLADDVGPCADYAVIKYETLKRVGFRDDQLHLLTGLWVDLIHPDQTDRHGVLMVSLPGGDWILTNFGNTSAPPGATPEQLRTQFVLNGAAIPATIFMDMEKVNYRVQFIPLLSQNEAGADRYYRTPNRTTGHTPDYSYIPLLPTDQDRLITDLAAQAFALRGGRMNGFNIAGIPLKSPGTVSPD
jgi:predicted transglutaminase-like cysteine proteinase